MKKKKVLFPELVGEMAKHGDTQITLGKVIGVSHGSISRRLAGLTKWSIDEMDKICEYYKKDYYELFKKEGK